jgi:transposase-like protein
MIAVKNKTIERTEGVRKEIKNPVVAPPREVGLHPNASVLPDPEVPAQAARRHFTTEYKLQILKQADACIESGSQGALLRREGLYASSLNAWRRQRDCGAASALASKKRGRKESVRNLLFAENEKLRKQNEQLSSRLRQAEIIIDVQKKISNILGIPLTTPEAGGKA